MGTAKNQLTPTIKKQILKVRDSAETNMFDCNAVMSIANCEGWHELVNYLLDRKNWGAYSHFILTGKTGASEDMEECLEDARYGISQVKFMGNNWISGKVGNLRFQAKVYAEASIFGINSGNVSKLTVWQEYGPIAINYDRGWDVKPKNAKEEKIIDTILDFCSYVYDGIKDFM